MPRNRKDQIDQDEKKILSELVKNSNQNIETIAKHSGFSRQKTWRIIQQLEENHIIWGYTAIVDEQKQGLQKFILLIKRSMQRIDDETADQIASNRLIKEYVKLGINVESSYYINGEYDWELIFTVPDLITAKKFTDALFQEYPGIISKIDLMQVLMTKRSHNILNPEKMKLKEFL
jgi:DNA-binding Lrp family transcriptional regulator